MTTLLKSTRPVAEVPDLRSAFWNTVWKYPKWLSPNCPDLPMLCGLWRKRRKMTTTRTSSCLLWTQPLFCLSEKLWKKSLILGSWEQRPPYLVLWLVRSVFCFVEVISSHQISSEFCMRRQTYSLISIEILENLVKIQVFCIYYWLWRPAASHRICMSGISSSNLKAKTENKVDVPKIAQTFQMIAGKFWNFRQTYLEWLLIEKLS